jgi:hypothetical protein
MFLYSIEGSIPADAATEDRKQDLARRICAELKRFDWEATFDGNAVSFLNNKNIFHQIVRLDRSTQLVDSGEFIIDGESIRYRLVTSPLVFWTAVLPLPLAFCLVIRSLIGAAGVIGYWLLTCVGGTFWISFRVRRALHSAAAVAPSPSLSP